jgi:hypothetical protein
MAVVTKTIGTAGRDYSTITSWEADLDDFSTVYSNGDDAVGECYADSDFSEQPIINGGGTSMTGLNSITLTVATSDRHDGTAGTGVRMVSNSQISVFSDKNVNISWIEMNQSGTTYGSSFSMVYVHNNSYYQKISNMLLHDATSASSIYPISVKYGHPTLANNIVYNVTHTGPYRGYGIHTSTYRESHAYNNTVYNIQGTHPSSAYNFGIDITNNYNIKNNISVAVGSAIYSGCFAQAATSNTSNNMSSDTTAPGSNSLTEVTTANQFVSIVAGSEDLHLVSGSEAVGAGVNLGSSDPVVQYDIDGAYRGTVWDMGADQTPATVTKSIGTSSRDYSTITAWEADLDTQGVYANGDSAVGECYNDSTFTQTDNLIIRSGGVVGLNSVTLTAATTDRHDGTAGTGAEIGVANMKRIFMQAGYNASVSIKNVVSWLDINGQGYGRTSLFSFYTANDELKNCICRSVGDQVNPASNSYNNIIYTGGAFIYNANYGASAAANIVNNTVYGVNRGITIGIANSNVSIKNNICAGTSIVDFDGNYGDVGYGVPQVSNNLSSDETAPGTDSLINKSASNQFVNIIGGSEDLHLAGSSDAIKAGVVLTEPEGVEYDIDGQIRAGLWDIGADQTVSGHIRRTLLGIG